MLPKLSVQFILLISLLLPVMSGHADCNTTSTPATSPSSTFVDNHDGTVTDQKTGLMWKRCSEGQDWVKGLCTYPKQQAPVTYNWQLALEQVQTVNSQGGYAGFTDWRVPNIKELESLVELQCIPAINSSVFPNLTSQVYWSASPYSGMYAYEAWYVDFYRGSVSSISKDEYSSVRLVRGGQ